VIGGGSWGTTVASLAARNAPTILSTRRAELAEEIDRDHINSAYMPDERLALLPPRAAGTSEALLRFHAACACATMPPVSCPR